MKTIAIVIALMLSVSTSVSARGRGGQPHAPSGGGAIFAPPPPVFVQPTGKSFTLDDVVAGIASNGIDIIPVIQGDLADGKEVAQHLSEGLKNLREYTYMGIQVHICEFDSASNAEKKADHFLKQNTAGNYNWSIVRDNIVIILGKELQQSEVDRFRGVLERMK